VSAVIVINYGNVGKWAGKRRIAFNTFAELSQKPEVYELVRGDIDRLNSSLPAGLRVRKYVNLHKEFDPDTGELTRTRNLRRTVLEEHYRGLIDAIYADRDDVSLEMQAGYQDGQGGTKTTTLAIKSVEGAVS
jgi:long-chain acyl-CoA synthetase